MSLNIPQAPAIPGWEHVYSGKVRDLYKPASPHPHGDVVLVVASDRISAYDYVLTSTIPGKGEILTALTLWWFDQIRDIVPDHTVEAEVPEQVAGRAMVCKRLDMFPVECVARGYLTGSGLVEYHDNQQVCGIPLPSGLVDGSKLPESIFTPATKAEIGDHDENVTFEAVEATIGTDKAMELRGLTLALYERAHDIARDKGIILADTKFEFGQDADGVTILADEILTPEDEWEPGKAQPSFDKQFVRDWLTSPESGWDKSGGTEPPALPDEIIEKTRARYLEAYDRLVEG